MSSYTDTRLSRAEDDHAAKNAMKPEVPEYIWFRMSTPESQHLAIWAQCSTNIGKRIRPRNEVHLPSRKNESIHRRPI